MITQRTRILNKLGRHRIINQYIQILTIQIEASERK